MAEPLSDKEGARWCRDHYGHIRNWAHAAMFAHLDRSERRAVRERIHDGRFPVPEAWTRDHAAEYRRKCLDALTELDLLEEAQRPLSRESQRAAREVVDRIAGLR